MCNVDQHASMIGPPLLPLFAFQAQRGILSYGVSGIAKIDTPKDHQKRCNLKKRCIGLSLI